MKYRNCSFLNKILFLNHIEKIKSLTIKKYLKDLFLLRNIFLKLLLFFLFGITIVSICFGARQIVIDYFYDSIKWNSGISFSLFENLSPSSVYLIQFIPCILSLLVAILVNNKGLISSFLIIFFGGFCNVIDRASPPHIGEVIDYIPFGSTVINLPDIFISCGTGLIVLTFIVQLIKILKDNSDKDNNIKTSNN